jgi:hypothetical protein
MSGEPKKPTRRRKAMLIAAIVFALYPLSIGPLAFLEGVGVLGEKAKDSIRPIYAPLGLLPVEWALRPYERECNGMGRQLHRATERA